MEEKGVEESVEIGKKQIISNQIENSEKRRSGGSTLKKAVIVIGGITGATILTLGAVHQFRKNRTQS